MKSQDLIIGSTPAYYAYPDDGAKHPSLIVIHEIWGLDKHIRDVVNRFSAEGYSVLAPNLFHGLSFEGKISPTLFDEMRNPETKDEAQKKMRALFAPIQAPEFAEKTLSELKQCVDYLLQDAHVNGEVAVLGFCFGGTYSLALAGADSRIKASVLFYGHPLASEKVKNVNCPVLAFYGEEDTALVESLPALKEAMKKEGKDFTAVVYPNAGHAFFNNTNVKMYNAEAAKDSWTKTLEFLKKVLK
jgi:carboxymethylenebutenolidase